MTVRGFLLFLVILINCIRFYGLEISPPGFYVDEAVGAAQVLCLKETGADFYQKPYPLFSRVAGGGYATAPYLLGEGLWTSLLGDSVAAFRSLMALVTALTIFFLYLWVKRTAGEKTAIWVAFLASISPWSFQFSRIAWDPPFAPMFLTLGLALLPIEFFKNGFSFGKKPVAAFLSVASFALAAYSYPPTRVTALVLLWVIPAVQGRNIGERFKWKSKLVLTFLFLIFLCPLIYWSLDPEFTARGRMLVLNSGYPMNPYRDAGPLELLWGFLLQVGKHLTPDFLLIKGDSNLRHSTGEFGVLSYLEALIIVTGVLTWPWWKKSITPAQSTLLWIGIAGVFLGIAPAALTWEGVPHALRAIGAWPFMAVLSGVLAQQVFSLAREEAARKKLEWVAALGGVLFFSFYLKVYFVDYPKISFPWFQTDPAPLSQAYHRMVVEGKSCSELRSK